MVGHKIFVAGDEETKRERKREKEREREFITAGGSDTVTSIPDPTRLLLSLKHLFRELFLAPRRDCIQPPSAGVGRLVDVALPRTSERSRFHFHVSTVGPARLASQTFSFRRRRGTTDSSSALSDLAITRLFIITRVCLQKRFCQAQFREWMAL